jgi:uncharacterized coiled-coil protein SlyX
MAYLYAFYILSRTPHHFINMIILTKLEETLCEQPATLEGLRDLLVATHLEVLEVKAEMETVRLLAFHIIAKMGNPKMNDDDLSIVIDELQTNDADYLSKHIRRKQEFSRDLLALIKAHNQA